MDGSTCAVVVRLVWPDIKVVFVEPSEADAIPDRGDEVTIFADVCPTRLEEYEGVYDHHASSFTRLGVSRDVVLDTSRCGCYLLMEHLRTNFPEKMALVENLCGVVDDYDRWVHQRPVSRSLAALHELLGQEEFVQRMLLRVQQKDFIGRINDWGLITAEERQMIGAFDGMKRRYVEEVAKNAFYVYIGKDKQSAVAVFADQHINDVGAALLEQHPAKDFAVMVNLLKRNISIRSRSVEHDCSKLAMEFPGGGGHPCSSGAPFGDEDWETMTGLFGGRRR
jgi:oligoribonuclease NrnB/cAMP/cGMP phosphodiesterase (DHH superfamily)